MIAVQSVGTAASATTGTLTVAWPSGVLAGDVALLFVTSSAGGTTETLSTAAGFTLIDTRSTGTGTAGTKLSVYWARASASGAQTSPVVTAGSDFKYGVIITYRGVIGSGSPVNANTGGIKTPASTSLTMSGVTTTVDDALIVYAMSKDTDSASAWHTSTTNSNLSWITERFDAGTISGLGGGIAVITGTAHTQGAIGNASSTIVSAINAYCTIALTPATPVTLPYTETFTGTNGAAIAAPWYDRQLSAGSGTIQTNQGRLTSTTTLNDIMRYEGLGIPILDDVDFSGTFHGNAANAKYVDIFIASSTNITAGNWEPSDGFVIEIEITAAGTTSGTNLIRSAAGVTTVLGSRVAMTIQPQTNVYGFRFQKTTTGGTTTVRYRIWDTSGAEPSTWDQSVTATNLIGVPGFSLISNTAVVQTVDFDDLVVSSGGVIVSPTAIATAEAFGTATANVVIAGSPGGIASAEAFGTPANAQAVTYSPTGIASGEAFGTASANVVITGSPTGIASGETFGTPTENATLTSTPTGIASGEAFGATSAVLTLTSTPTGVASAEAFGTPTAVKTLTSSPSGIASAEAFGSVAAIIPITATPTGIASGEAFGTPTASSGYNAFPTGVGSAESFGAPSAVIPITASPTGIASAQAVGTPTASGVFTATPTGIASAEALGTPSAVKTLTSSPGGVTSAEAFGTPSAVLTLTSTPTGVASAEAFGTPVVTIIARYTPTGIVSAEAFGSPTATLGQDASRSVDFTVEPLLDRYMSTPLEARYIVEADLERYEPDEELGYTAEALAQRYTASPL